MRMLLTPDQESTLWHLQETLRTPTGEVYHYSPYYLREMGAGEYERLTFEQLPEEAKEMILALKEIKIPTDATNY